MLVQAVSLAEIPTSDDDDVYGDEEGKEEKKSPRAMKLFCISAHWHETVPHWWVCMRYCHLSPSRELLSFSNSKKRTEKEFIHELIIFSRSFRLIIGWVKVEYTVTDDKNKEHERSIHRSSRLLSIQYKEVFFIIRRNSCSLISPSPSRSASSIIS